MSRRNPFICETEAWELYVRFRKWVLTENTHPLAYSFAVQIMEREDKSWTLNKFRYHWKLLLIEHLVRHERRTNSVIIARAWELERLEKFGYDPRVTDKVRLIEQQEKSDRLIAEALARSAEFDDNLLGESIPLKKVSYEW